MKIKEKKRYQEFIEYIEFPTLIYLYETKRIIAINKYARDVIGNNVKGIKDVFLEKTVYRLPKETLENGCYMIYNHMVGIHGKNIEIDAELSSISMGEEHVVFCLFELSSKQYFLRYQSINIPRMIWKDIEKKCAWMNMPARADCGYSEKLGRHISAFKLEYETREKILEDEKELLRTKKNQYNMIETMKMEQRREPFFVKCHRMPLIDKNETTLGLLVVYKLLLNRDEYQKLLSQLLWENNILNEIIGGNGLIVISWMEEEGWPVEFISSNISQYGYQTSDFYSGTLVWKDVMWEEDYNRVKIELEKTDRGKKQIKKLKFRMKQADGRMVWMKMEVANIMEHDNIKCRHGVIWELASEEINLD